MFTIARRALLAEFVLPTNTLHSKSTKKETRNMGKLKKHETWDDGSTARHVIVAVDLQNTWVATCEREQRN
jgi:hypothetical protein